MVPKVILAAIGLFLVVSIQLAFAQSEIDKDEDVMQLEITTDKASYKPNQIMTITFEIDTYSAQPCFKFDIIYPSGYVYPSLPCPAAEDTDYEIAESKTIQRKVELNSIDFKESGEYTIRVYYDGRVSDTTFILSIPSPSPASNTKSPSNDLAVYEGVNSNEKGINELQAADSEKDQRIADLEAENQSLKDELAKLSKKIDDLNAIIWEQIQVMMNMINNMTAAT